MIDPPCQGLWEAVGFRPLNIFALEIARVSRDLKIISWVAVTHRAVFNPPIRDEVGGGGAVMD